MTKKKNNPDIHILGKNPRLASNFLHVMEEKFTNVWKFEKLYVCGAVSQACGVGVALRVSQRRVTSVARKRIML